LTLEMIEAIDRELALMGRDPKGRIVLERPPPAAFCAGIDQRALIGALESGDRERTGRVLTPLDQRYTASRLHVNRSGGDGGSNMGGGVALAAMARSRRIPKHLSRLSAMHARLLPDGGRRLINRCQVNRAGHGTKRLASAPNGLSEPG